MHPKDKEIGSRIRARRIMLGVTQERLGEVIGVTFQQVQKYEIGVNRISGSRLYDAAVFLGVKVGYFFGEDCEEGAELPSSKEILSLVRAYIAIPDEGVKRSLLSHIKQLARVE